MKTILHNMHQGNPVKCGAEQELLLLQKELMAVKENASRFTAVVAHDLQAPLRMITGFLELLSGRYSQQLDEKAKQYIGFAVKGAGKMKSLIKDMQLYASLTNDNSPIEEINLHQLVNSLAFSNEKAPDSAGVNWQIGALPAVFGKKNQVGLLFKELLSNAVKFSEEKPCQVIVSGRDTSKGFVISVTDKGIGFDPVYKENIFDVFRKLHPEEAGYQGNGIGLALCKRICELHGWEIIAASAPGKGASFIITIPELNQSSKSC